MSEITEAFAAMKEAGKAKKLANRTASTKILEELNIPFESKNNGIHLVVQGKHHIIDFWPSTGKFTVRNTSAKGRGIKGVLELCNVKK